MAKALHALAAAALAIPALAQAAAAPSQTTVGYHFNAYGEDNYALADVDAGSQSKANQPYDILTHQLHVSSGYKSKFGFALDYAFETLSGASVQTAYRVFEKEGTEWTSTDKLQLVLGGASIVEKRHEVVANGRYFFNAGSVGLEGYYSTENDYRSVGAAFDAAFDGQGKQLTYSVGASYYNDLLNPTSGAGVVGQQPTTANPGRLEAWNQQKHKISVFQGLSTVINKNLIWRIGASGSFQMGHLSDPYREMLVNCGTDCRDDVNTAATDESLMNGVVNYAADHRPDDRLSWTVSTGLRQYFDAVNGSFALDLRYYGDNWEVHSGTAELAWNQRFTLSTNRSTGMLRWMEKYGATTLISPYVRVYGQKQSLYYMPIIDPAVLEDTTVPGAPGLPSSTIEAGKMGVMTYYTSDPRLASYAALALGVNLEADIAGVRVVGGVEDYQAHADWLPEVKYVPGLPQYLRWKLGLEYRF